VRECAGILLRFAKEGQICTFVIGHITKDGAIAGPKLLEHMVDTVLMFEGEKHLNYRILRTIKNRFGSSSELGIYEMNGEGLRPVLNPSEILLSHRDDDLSGVAIGSMLEGNRPLMIEIQSLVSQTGYSTPQRSSTGFDTRRLSMLLAVLEKRGGFRFNNQDVFLNITGGIKVEDPAIDLAICVSLISSLENRSIPASICFAAEVGLGGEVRAVNRIENRLAEAERLGFKTIFISSYNFSKINPEKYGLQVIGVKRLDELIMQLFLKK
jgi:DNA repair protein RadA/Sms